MAAWRSAGNTNVRTPHYGKLRVVGSFSYRFFRLSFNFEKADFVFSTDLVAILAERKLESS